MPTATTTWVDGQQADALPLPDRALAYGDGLFETLLLAGQRITLQDYHFARLGEGLRRLGIPDCMTAVREQLAVACKAVTHEHEFSVMRLTVSRGAGPRGYAPPTDAIPRIIITLAPLSANPWVLSSPADLGETAVRWGKQPLLAGIKHLNRLEQVLAAADCARSGHDEVLMLGQCGEPLSVTTGNLFVCLGDKLLTPQLCDAGITGTRRQLIIEQLGAACGLQVSEARLDVAQLLAADELFYCNTVVGLRPVSRFRHRRWLRHPVTSALHGAYVGWLA
ncbi:aminodeoxychorismate lyase [Kineobactrum sediminis]|uniref:aminodeoxychorismate lyase n=1 Tax=Kineobactrum sediminis TaxID=1905677 RepID=UPI00139015CD|nr:aminodeoxychorismate lyase [Kineobactrum sediminis]